MQRELPKIVRTPEILEEGDRDAVKGLEAMIEWTWTRAAEERTVHPQVPLS